MRTGLLVTVGVAAAALGVADVAYRTRNWGATAREMAMALPGDGLVAEPVRAVTRGVTVQAPPAEVWRWLLEVGRVHGGVELVPGRSMVLLGSLDDATADAPRAAVTSLHVLPMGAIGATSRHGADPGRCRLVCRSRASRPSAAARAAATVLEPLALVLTRRMLLGVKERAERSALRTAVSTTVHPA